MSKGYSVSLMYIKIHIDGLENPLCVPVRGADILMRALEKKGKTFRLGNTV